MKKPTILACAIVALLAGQAGRAAGSVRLDTAVSIEIFSDTLSPYGDWMVLRPYGRVWRPSVEVVGIGFRPYLTGGHWVYTDYGWSFESFWDWGWAPFHYGRWLFDPGLGWVWVPDRVWAPAWVSWRFGGGYAGWAPLPPRGAAVIIERHRSYWCFVETRHFVERDVHRYALPGRHYHQAYGVTAPIAASASFGGVRTSVGPPPGQVSTAVGKPIEPARTFAPPPGVVSRHEISPRPHSPAKREPFTPPPGTGRFGSLDPRRESPPRAFLPPSTHRIQEYRPAPSPERFTGAPQVDRTARPQIPQQLNREARPERGMPPQLDREITQSAPPQLNREVRPQQPPPPQFNRRPQQAPVPQFNREVRPQQPPPPQFNRRPQQAPVPQFNREVRPQPPPPQFNREARPPRPPPPQFDRRPPPAPQFNREARPPQPPPPQLKRRPHQAPPAQLNRRPQQAPAPQFKR